MAQRKILSTVDAEFKVAVTNMISLLKERKEAMLNEIRKIYASGDAKIEEKFWAKVEKIVETRSAIVEENIQTQRRRVKASGLVYSDELVAEDCRARTQAKWTPEFKPWIARVIKTVNREEIGMIAVWSEFFDKSSADFVKQVVSGGNVFLDELEFSLKTTKDYIEVLTEKRAKRTTLTEARFTNHLENAITQREQRIKEFREIIEKEFSVLKSYIVISTVLRLKELASIDLNDSKSALSHCFYRPLSSFSH